MSTSYSTNLALALPATGELSGTWGTTVNTNITNMLDEALGYQAYSATGGADTITIPDGTTGVARSIYIQLNGTGGGSVAVPATKTKMYFVFNNTASAITFKVTGQTGVSIPAAAKMALVSNGTDVIVAQNYFAALTLGAALPVASGGTGLSSGTSGGVLAYTATGTLASSAALAANALVIGGGAGAAPSTTTTGTGVVTALGVNTGSAGAFVVNGGALGTPSSGTVTNLTGTASININGTVGATTANTGAFTTLSASSGNFTTTGGFLLGADIGATTVTNSTRKAGIIAVPHYTNSASKVLQSWVDSDSTANLIYYGGGLSGFNAATQHIFKVGATTTTSDGTVVATISSSGLAVTGTLSATGGVTLSGGTANGVAYLDASKVLTTGSALTFNGTSLGIGSSSYGDAGSITASIGVAGTTTGGLQLWSTTTGSHTIQWGDGTTGSDTYRGAIEYAHNGDSMRFYTSATEQMRLNSTGLAVTGTLSATGNATVGNAVAATDVYLNIAGVASRAGGIAFKESGVDKWLIGNGAASNNGKFELYNTTGVVVLSVDKTSSVSTFGAGVAVTGTLSATSNIYTSARYFAQRQSGSLSFAIGGYSDGSAATVLTGAIGDIVAFGNVGGDGVIFANSNTERMRLTDTGLGIGTSSPAYKLDVDSTGGTVASLNSTNANGPGLRFARSGTANGYVGSAKYIVNGALADFGIDVSGANNLIFGTNDTERMRLDSSGNLGIGTTSPAYKLHVRGADATANLVVGNTTEGTQFEVLTYQDDKIVLRSNDSSNVARAIAFETGLTERARIDSSGNLLVGTTSVSTTTGNSFVFGVSSGSALAQICHPSGAVSGTGYAYFNYDVTTIGSITQSGTTAVLYNLTSDQRLKENIQDAAPASALIDAIQVRQFDWKSDGSHQRYGFVAQELVTVAPEAVHAPADPDEMMAVDYSKLVPLLVKELQSLRARVAQLESKP